MKRANALAALLIAAACSAAAAETPTGAPAEWGVPMMGGHAYWMALLERFEYGAGDDHDSYLWDAQAWYGGDYKKLMFKTEGEGATGESADSAELQLLYGRLVAPFWTLQTGVRHDVRPGADDVSYAVLGVQGLAPQRFETDLSAFLSDDGDVTLRAEFEYDLLLTQRLLLQPRLELNASLSDTPQLGLASGLTHSEAGLRLRYQIRREFAPYLGVRWERLHGGTHDLARAQGEPGSSTSLVLGLRAWF